MSTKLTLEYTKNYFEEHNCQLLEKTYFNARSLMLYRCSCGDINKISFDNFKKGKRCRKCANKKLRAERQFSYKYVKKFFEKENCELLEKKYINGRTKVEYRCSCGNISKISFNSFKNGNRCRKCSGSEKHSFEHVYNYFKDNGCELIDKTYKHVHFPMKYKCVCGRISKISFYKFKFGQRCQQCAIERNSGENNCNYNPLLTAEERLIKRNYEAYREWRKEVYKRDNYTCQKCGTRGGELNAHHIESYSNNKDLRIVKSNGITFCEKCHKKFHNIYGLKNNNKKQLDKFLEKSMAAA